MKFPINIPKNIKTLSEIFREKGYDLFLVGGCVRDALLEIEPKDFDLVTNAFPEDVVNILKEISFITNVLETGKNFGVINAITKDDEYEIATFRTDGNYQDGRRPDTVEFATINEDVLRRDLTINALYYDIENGEVIDLVDGIEDLYKKTITTVGKAKDRFAEDRLRILRAVRFSERFQANMDSEIVSEIISDNDISKVSKERIRDEFIKTIKSTHNIKKTLILLNVLGLLEQILEGLAFDYEYSLLETDLSYLQTLSVILNGNDESIIKSRLNELKYGRNEIHNILLGIELENVLENKEDIDRMYKFFKSVKGGNPDIESLKSLNEDASELLDKVKDFEFKVTGEEVMKKFSISPGPELGLKIRELEYENIRNLF